MRKTTEPIPAIFTAIWKLGNWNQYLVDTIKEFDHYKQSYW